MTHDSAAHRTSMSYNVELRHIDKRGTKAALIVVSRSLAATDAIGRTYCADHGPLLASNITPNGILIRIVTRDGKDQSPQRHLV